jgi:beta-phosphoglucomutase
MKYKAIIFDLDGVICSTDEYHYQAWKVIADELGIYFDKEINDLLRGVSRLESLEIILKKGRKVLDASQKEIYLEKKNKVYCEMLKGMSPASVSQDVLNTLEELKKQGIKIGIGSSSKNAKYILKRIGLEEKFDVIVDGTMITRSKPDPEVFLKAVSLAGETPSESLVVEDADAGIEAALEGGMNVAGIGQFYKNVSVTYRINNLSELLRVI